MAVLNTTGTFANNEQVTSTKLNNIIDQAFFVEGARSGTTLEVTAGGQLKVGIITASEMGANSVEAAAIKNGEVTVAKLSTGAPTWTSGGNVTILGSTTALSSVTATTASVSIGSARTASGASNIDFNSTFPLTSYEARISRESGENGNLVFTNTGTGTIVFGSIPLGSQSGTSPIYGLRAYANIAGKTALSTISGSATRSGSTVTCTGMTSHGFVTNDIAYLEFDSTILSGPYQVTRIDDNTLTITTASSGTITTPVSCVRRTIYGKNIKCVTGGKVASDKGSYAVTFTTPMPDANYSIVGSAKSFSTTSPGNAIFSFGNGVGYYAKTANGFSFSTRSDSGSNGDSEEINFQVVA